MEPKIWKEIDGYEGLYSVSSDGQVFSHISGRCLKPLVTRTGYLRVHLVKDHKIKCMAIHAMLSDNPNSGFYEAETSRTLDCNGGRPDCSQGGIAIVEKEAAYALQGSMIGRSDKNGPQGDGINEDVSFTLDATDRLS